MLEEDQILVLFVSDTDCFTTVPYCSDDYLLEYCLNSPDVDKIFVTKLEDIDNRKAWKLINGKMIDYLISVIDKYPNPQILLENYKWLRESKKFQKFVK